MNIDTTNTNTNIKARQYPSYNAVQINLQNPTANVSTPNVIYDYPKANGQIYYPPIQQNPNNINKGNITRTPSGVSDYENYSEYDKNGQEVVSVKYSKEGDAIVQKITTKSPDGTILEKTLKNSPNFKNSNISITDKDGNVLLAKEKTYQKIDDDKAQTITNGKIYNISGLKGEILTVEHNGETITLDLNKMLNPNVKVLESCISPDNFPVRETKITLEEKEKLFNRIKSLGGDDLFKLSKSVEHLQFLDEKSHEAFYVEKGKTLLLSPKEWENSHTVTMHELGHAINHYKTNTLLSDNEQFKNIREYEKENFKQHTNMTKGDKFLDSKFLFGNQELSWKDTKDNQEDGSYLRDETFAESYNNLNCMDILHYDDEVLPLRTLSLFRYLPRTMVEVEKLSQI